MTDISPAGAEDRARAAIDRALALAPDKRASIFTSFDAARIMDDARALDADPERSAKPLAGVLISVKDLFDETGIITTAGSTILANGSAAIRDAEAVRRLKAAGAIAFGRTTMSEFAYSGVGLNPHFGNPSNALDPARITGGSTSGGAVTVALGLADMALGSDTGGSVRIPATLNGLSGFKPTQASVPLDGAFPLSQTYDSIGPLARTIGECADAYTVLSQTQRPAADTVRNLRIGIARGLLTEGLDEQVARDFEIALTRLAAAGFEFEDVDLPMLEGFGGVNRIIVATEAHAIHKDRLGALEKVGDRRVLSRIRAAETFGASDLADAYARRRNAVAAFEIMKRDFDAFVMPTLPTVAPLIADVEADFDRLNALMLRNPSAVNFLDGCAATLPMQDDQKLATGLTIFAPGGADWRVLDIARQAQDILAA
ncbi:amidase family protein [Mesorhizobium sp. YIM 152430]|uniref:amidase family protein n=1 Tax=Mesorhizobium sp. YIM 152430 TaxID=3031761 RepID=UPI0023DA0F19|nr:amidase family protein [Mesorhizobium sp. YIM 152430]MDF1598936.1 amidase family protein [Mesorhizobium sp. YIM 152430]